MINFLKIRDAFDHLEVSVDKPQPFFAQESWTAGSKVTHRIRRDHADLTHRSVKAGINQLEKALGELGISLAAGSQSSAPAELGFVGVPTAPLSFTTPKRFAFEVSGSISFLDRADESYAGHPDIAYMHVTFTHRRNKTAVTLRVGLSPRSAELRLAVLAHTQRKFGTNIDPMAIAQDFAEVPHVVVGPAALAMTAHGHPFNTYIDAISLVVPREQMPVIARMIRSTELPEWEKADSILHQLDVSSDSSTLTLISPRWGRTKISFVYPDDFNSYLRGAVTYEMRIGRITASQESIPAAMELAS